MGLPTRSSFLPFCMGEYVTATSVSLLVAVWVYRHCVASEHSQIVGGVFEESDTACYHRQQVQKDHLEVCQSGRLGRTANALGFT